MGARYWRFLFGGIPTLAVSLLIWSASAARADTGGQAVAFQIDPGHNGYQPNPDLTLPLQKNWTLDGLSGASYPVVVNGVVYVSAGPWPTLYAIDLATGRILWHRWFSMPASAPAYDDGRLYVSNADGVFALDPSSGATMWAYDLASDPPAETVSGSPLPPTAADGYVYAEGSTAENHSTMYALDESTGELAWTSTADAGQSIPAVGPGGVYSAVGCYQSFTPSTGELRWTSTSACGGSGYYPSALGDGNFYGFGIYGNSIVSADTGAQLGTFPGSDATPAIAAGVLYVIDSGTLKAISDDGLGSVLWTFAGDGQLDTAPVVAGGVVYVGSLQGTLYAVDTSTGMEEWSADPGEFGNFWGSNINGIAVADQSIVVPAANQLSVFSDSTTSITTTTSLMSADQTSLDYGQQITLTDTIQGGDGGGTVDFEVAGTPISGCSAVALSSVASGYAATCTTSALMVGNPTIMAYYSGDAGYTSSVTYDMGVTVSTDPTTTQLGVSTSSSHVGDQVVLTATVTGSDGGGTVEFDSNSSPITGCSAVPLMSGVSGETATCTTTSLAAGYDTLDAYYSGDATKTNSYGSANIGVTGGDYTWSGAAAGPAFSYYANWAGGSAPPGWTVGTLTFPNVSGAKCVSNGGPTCYVSADNDLTGLSPDGINVDSDLGYDIAGNAITVGSGGITAESPSGSGTPPTFGTPITLSAPQAWTIDEGPTGFTGPIVGDQALSLTFQNGSIEPKSMEVGAITAQGNGGFYLDGNMAVNSTNFNPIALSSGAGIEADQTNNSIGPTTVEQNGWISVGGVDDGGGRLTVDESLTFDSSSELDLAVDAAGTMAGLDYSQVTSSGDIDLSGAQLNVSLGTDANGLCEDLQPGQTLTLLSTSGSISGRFWNYPTNGATVDIANDCDNSSQDASGTLSYSSSAVTLTITAAGNAAEYDTPPGEITAPSLSGTAQVGQTLQVNPGNWSDANSFAYSWWACDETTCNQIPDETAQSLRLTSAQLVGKQIAAIVTVNGPGGASSDYTNLTNPVTAEPVPVASVLPMLSGTASVGDSLSTSNGSWSNSPTSYAYQWQRCSSSGTNCTAISDATDQTYVLTSADTGATLNVQVTATNYGGKSTPASSGTTAVVIAATTASSPSSSPSAVEASIQGVLTPSGKASSLTAVLSHHGYTFSFHAPAAGTLSVLWTTTLNRKAITVGRGSATASGAKTTNVVVRLTTAGIAALKRHTHLRIRARVSFKANGANTIVKSGTFTLSRHSTGHRPHSARLTHPTAFSRVAKRLFGRNQHVWEGRTELPRQAFAQH